MKTKVEYDSSGRMKYNPEFHKNTGKVWTDKELSYLCKMKDTTSLIDISLALERTYTSTMQKHYILRRRGLIDHYKSMEDTGGIE